MSSTKKLIEMARKWQKTNKKMAAASHSKQSSVVDKGNFVIYTTDEIRFVIPLAFLGNRIFHELLKMSEEEYGLPSDGPITLPCDSIAMNYIIPLVKRGLAKDLDEAVLSSITDNCCSSYSKYIHEGHADQTEGISIQQLVSGY